MKPLLLIRLAFPALLLLYFAGCGSGPVAGGASDTETAFIRGALVDMGQTKKAGQTVYLYDTNFIPIPDWKTIDSVQGFHDSTVTDSEDSPSLLLPTARVFLFYFLQGFEFCFRIHIDATTERIPNIIPYRVISASAKNERLHL